MTDEQFITSKSHKIIDFKPRAGKRTRGLTVGKYFIITNGQDESYIVYNQVLRVPLIKTNFNSVIDAYQFCQKLLNVYGELLHILADENYAEHLFRLVQYTIENGMKLYEGIRSFENLKVIKRSDLAFILDKNDRIR